MYPTLDNDPPPAYDQLSIRNDSPNVRNVSTQVSVVPTAERKTQVLPTPKPTFCQLLQPNRRKILICVALWLTFTIALISLCVIFGDNTQQEVKHYSTISSRFTTPAKSKTTEIPIPWKDADGCSGQSASTFLFAYSNDLSPEVVKQARTAFYSSPPNWALYGNIRFDTKIPGDFHFHDHYRGYDTSIDENLPDPADGFSDSTTGSDIFRVIERFLETPYSRKCGSILYILLKRMPNERDASNLSSLLQKHRIFIHVVQSINSSGGENSEIMYNLASETNGFFAFQNDQILPSYYQTVLSTSAVIYAPYLIYSANSEVQGRGSMILPLFKSPINVASFMVEVSVHDRNASSEFPYFKLAGISTYQDRASFSMNLDNFELKSINSWSRWINPFRSTEYEMKLDYSYSSSKQVPIMIRIFAVDGPR